MFDKLFGWPDLHDLPAIHDRNAGREITDDRHGVRDKQVGEAEVALELGQQVDDLSSHTYVESRDRFVADNELGPQSQGAGDANALALASREFVRIAAAGGFVQADSAQKFGNAVVEFCAGGFFEPVDSVEPEAAESIKIVAKGTPNGNLPAFQIAQTGYKATLSVSSSNDTFSFALAETVEYFEIPRDIIAICLGKSTYARCGIICNVTPLEPEWRGRITIEISNTTPLPAKIYANEGLCQVLFFESDEACEVSYKDKKGKYQSQSGIVLPRL